MIFANQVDPAQQQVAPATLQVAPVYPMNRRGPMQPQAATSGGGGKGLGDMDIGKLIKMFQGKSAAAQSLMGQGDPDPDLQYLQEAAMSGGGDGGATGGDGAITAGDGSSAAAPAAIGDPDPNAQYLDLAGSYF
jgi:hypothetical protein